MILNIVCLFGNHIKKFKQRQRCPVLVRKKSQETDAVNTLVVNTKESSFSTLTTQFSHVVDYVLSLSTLTVYHMVPVGHMVLSLLSKVSFIYLVAFFPSLFLVLMTLSIYFSDLSLALYQEAFITHPIDSVLLLYNEKRDFGEQCDNRKELW